MELIEKMVSSDGAIFKMNAQAIERNVVMNCLKILAELGDYESHAMNAFEKIAKTYNIDVTYTEMLALAMIDKDKK